jgi:rare lipoprotein A
MNSRKNVISLFTGFFCLLIATMSFANIEYGKAAYYNSNYDGNKTKSGEVYSSSLMTCAHLTLPFGTKVRVTRLDNGAAVVVRVNDRLGIKSVEKGRIVDLSYAAALQIDLVNAGIANVKLEIITDDQPQIQTSKQEKATTAPLTEKTVAINKTTKALPTTSTPKSTTTITKDVASTASILKANALVPKAPSLSTPAPAPVLSSTATAVAEQAEARAPLTTFAPEFGKASYYNDKFEGKKTASGEKYAMADLTCAHKTLKFGTIVRVTRLDNNESVDVRVNDRGPYSEGHIVDLSRAAAENIGLIKAGVLKVKLEVIEEAPAPVSKKDKKEKKDTIKDKKEKPAADEKSPTKSKDTGFIGPTQTPMLPELVGVGSASGKKGVVATKEPTKSIPTIQKLSLLDNAFYKIDLTKAQQKGFAVQLFSLSSAEPALVEAAKLQENFKGKVLLQTATDGSCKILLGPCKDRKEADKLQKAATKKGHPKCYVVSLDADK